jgi:hypothetical protein|tara:strand:- start:966 stop:1340 length:375 start_codon:yes stop_codon:yes gene_type:complete
MLITSGCVLTKTHKRGINFLEEFQQSGSMCIDALSVNLAKADCLAVSSNQSPLYVERHYIKCVKTSSKQKNSAWNDKTFVVISLVASDETIELLSEEKPLCADETTLIAVIKTEAHLPKKRYLF